MIDPANERITYTNGELDEIVGAGGVHLERLSDDNWFLNIVRQNGSSVALWFTSKDLHKPPMMEIRDA